MSNKIKQSVPVSKKKVMLSFTFCTLVVLIIRFVQLLTRIDPDTGFFKQMDLSAYLFYCIIAVGCFLAVFASYINRNTLPVAVRTGKSKPLCAAAVICAAGFLIDCFQAFAIAGNLASANVGVGNIAGMMAYMKTGALPSVLQALFAVPCFVYFLIVATSFAKGTDSFRKRRIFALMPIAWGVMRMIRRFVRQISFVNVSDLLLELVMIAFILLFFMAFAQISSDVYADGAMWRLAGYGLPAAALCLLTSLPRLLFTVSGHAADYVNAYHPLYPCDLTLAAFIIVYLFARCDAPAATAETQQTNEPAQDGSATPATGE